MKKILFTLAAVLLAAGSLSGCNGMQQQDVGMIVGGVAGGAIGSAVSDGSPAGTIVGAVAGGYIGREVSRPRY